MKRTITKLVLLLLAVLTTGSVNATVYNFYENITDATGATDGDDVTVATFSHKKLKYVEDATTFTYGDKFAVGYRIGSGAVNVSDNYVFRNKNEYQGLQIKWSDRTFAILGVTNGQRIKITVTHGGLSFVGQPALKNVTADAAVSDLYYTVSTNESSVNILMKATANSTYVKSVEIVDPETVTVGVAEVENTYDFTNMTSETSGAAITSGGEYETNTIIIADANDKDSNARKFDERFAVNVTSGNGWKWRYNSDARYNGLWARYQNKSDLYIRNLKAGDVVTISYGDKTMRIADVDDTETTGTNPYTIGKAGDLHLVANEDGVYIKSIEIETPAQNIGGATLVSSNGLDFTDLTIKAYVAISAADGTVTFTQVNKVPANTPLYLKADAAVSEDVPVITDGFETITTNLLKGSATAATTGLQSSDAGEGTHYYLFGVQGGVAGFYHVPISSTYTSASGKAYLQLTTAQAGVGAGARISMIFDEDSETTGINDVRSKKEEVRGEYYDLSGRRVAQPTRGLYIVNGKKVIIK